MSCGEKLIHFSLLFSPDDSELMNPGAGNSNMYFPLEVPFGRQHKDLIGAINYYYCRKVDGFTKATAKSVLIKNMK